MVETGSGNPQGKASTYRGFLPGSLRLTFLGGTKGFLCLHLCMDHLAPQSGADKNIKVREVIVKKKKMDLVLFFLTFPNYYLTSSGKIKNKGTIAREWPFCGVNHPRPPWGVDTVSLGLFFLPISLSPALSPK